MRKLLVVGLILLGAEMGSETAAQTKAAGAQRLSIEDALRWRLASNPVLSPDGRRVAYLASENDFEKSRTVTYLWWVDTETRQARRLTAGEENIADPRWSADGRWLAFLAARAGQEERSAKPKAQVWLLPVDGGEAFALTDAGEGVLHYRWSPDGKSIYYAAREPLPKPAEELRAQQQKRRQDAVVVDEEKYRKEIWRIGVEERKAERVFAGDLGLDSFEPSPDGKWIVYRTNYSGEPDDTRKFDLWLLEASTGARRQLTRWPGEESSPVWSPDSTRVAFLAPREPETSYSQPEVFLVPVAASTPAAEPQRLTRNFSGHIERLHWPAKSESIHFAAGFRTGNRLHELNPASGAVRSASPEALFLTQPDWSADLGTCVAIQEGPASLPDVVLLRPAAEPQKLSELNPQLKQFALGAQEVIRWKSKDGMEIEGVLVKPPDWQPGQKYPLLVEIHGGPHGHRSNTLTSGNFPQAWASRGWLVLQPNFRGSSAYGHEFGIANRGDIGGRDFEDILAGVDFAVAQGWADEKRMAVMGGSYGGYMTNWIIGRTKRFQAAVSLFGIFSLITDYSNSTFPSWEPDYLAKFYWEDLDAYLDRSPMKHVKQITTPVLIIHGDEDNNTFISNSKEMYQALKALGRTVKFVRLPREGHGFREPNHRMEQFLQAAAWLETHALGAGEERARAVTEAAQKEGWELKVAGVRTPESYAGIKARGRFVEVELLIRAIEPATGRFSLLVFDTAGSDVALTAVRPTVVSGQGGPGGDQAVYPVGVVAESLGERLLVKSSAQVLALAPDKDGHHAAMAVAVAFDAPVDAREFLLRVKNFPPIRIELPIPANGPR